MIVVKFYCVVVNNGDGSASALYFGNKKTAQLACDYEEKSGEAFTDNKPEKITLKFNEKGMLLNQSAIRDYNDDE